jgi:hypothetical protein
LRHRERGSVGEVVIVADDEGVERVLRIEIPFVVGRDAFVNRLGRL